MRLILILLCIVLTGCAARTYRVCFRGAYTHDVYCSAPTTKANAEHGVAHEGADYWVEKNRDGNKQLVYRPAGTQPHLELPYPVQNGGK